MRRRDRTANHGHDLAKDRMPFTSKVFQHMWQQHGSARLVNELKTMRVGVCEGCVLCFCVLSSFQLDRGTPMTWSRRRLTAPNASLTLTHDPRDFLCLFFVIFQFPISGSFQIPANGRLTKQCVYKSWLFFLFACQVLHLIRCSFSLETVYSHIKKSWGVSKNISLSVIKKF